MLAKTQTHAPSRQQDKIGLVAMRGEEKGFCCAAPRAEKLSCFDRHQVKRLMVMAPHIHPINLTRTGQQSRRIARKRHTIGRRIGRRRAQTTTCLLAGLLAISSLFSVVSAGNNYNDDANNNNNNNNAYNNQNDDAASANKDAAAADDFYAAGDDDAGENTGEGAQANDIVADDDVFRWDQNVGFHWDQNVGFDGVSVMPLSCVN